MIVIKLCGGMGNQLFQYALGRMLAVSRNLKVRFDPFSGFADDFFNRKYCLHHFNTVIDLIEPGESLKLKYFRERQFAFDPEVVSIPDETYLEGYWQSEKYFKPIESLIREELSLKYPLEGRNLEITEEIAATNSVCVHVRRQFGICAGKVNMKAVNLHGVASLNYYRACIEQITGLVDGPHFFVFGDDPQWARENLEFPSAATFVDHNGSGRDFEDLRLMSCCKHFIIANSSFSWWGAWLSSSREKKVFAPDRWFNDTKLDTKDLVPDDWIKVPDSNCSEVKVTTHNCSADSGDDQKITVYRRERGSKPVNISVIIPCYNQARYLPEAVESIVKQSYRNWECIIVNDGSSDNTSDVARQLIALYPEHSIHFIDKPHSGVSDTRNIGIETASGQWILPLDSDDRFDSTFMQKAMDIVEREPQVDIVSTNLQKFGSEQGQWEPEDFSPQRILYKNLLPYASLYRKELWAKVGGYDGLLSDIKQSEDWSFWINCSRYNPVVRRVPEQLLHYRVHQQSVYQTMQKPYGELPLAFIVTSHPDLYPREHLESAWQMIADSPDEIYEKISEAVTKHSQEGPAFFWRGLCNERRGMSTETIVDYQKAAHGVATPTWQALLPLARLQQKQGNAAEARENLSRLSGIRADFAGPKTIHTQPQRTGHRGDGKSRILFYCDRLGNSDSSPAGTVIATKNMAKAWFGIDSNAQIHLTGDLVRREELHQSLKIVPLPKAEHRQQFIDSYDIVFFATHVRYFNGISKRPGQLWVLHQHCWYASDPVTMAHWNDFDVFVSLSQMHRDSLKSEHIPNEKMVIIPNLIDVNTYKPMDVQRNNHSILFVGGLHRHKGLHILLDALEIVRQQISDVQLQVYGDGAMWRGGDAYGELLKKRRIEGVHFQGYLENKDMPRVYSEHSILCLPSILETFPLVPIEAQACGCIPVVHRVGGAPATLNDGVTGFLYEPNNAEQLAQTIIQAIETIDKDPAMRERALEFVRANLNSANTTQFILPLRDKLAKAAAINSAEAFFQDNNIQAAETESERLLELYPDQPELLLLKGQLALHNGNVEQCMGALQTIIANTGPHQMAMNNLGVLAIKQGDNFEALRYLLGAYQLNPYDKNTAINCVIVLKAHDMLTEARMVLLMYLTKVGEDAQLLELLQEVNDLIAEHSFVRQDKSGREETCNRPLVFPVSKLAAEDPLISVIMPVYNCQDYISQAIESVLIQTYPKFELVIIDDGSTDNTKQIIDWYRDSRIKYIYKENAGPSSARNLGIKHSKGQFIMPLDADDMMTPDFIARHLEEFKSNPEADLVYSDVLLIGDKGNPLRVMSKPAYDDRSHMIRDLFRYGHPVIPFRLGIRRSVFDKIGLYDETVSMPEDYDMMRRFVKAGLNAHHLWETLHLRRMQTESLSRSMNIQKARDHFEVVRRFTETFEYHELFPDVDWDRIPAKRREVHGKCLIGASYMNLGNEYLHSRQECMSDIAFEMACGELTDCLRLDPNNENVRRLLQQCRQNIAKNQDSAAIITP